MTDQTKPAAPRSAVWCNYCAAYIRPDGLKSCLRKTCEHKDKKR